LARHGTTAEEGKNRFDGTREDDGVGQCNKIAASSAAELGCGSNKKRRTGKFPFEFVPDFSERATK
jgi:hypothetical protein